MTEAQGRDGATVAELRLRKNHSGERGPAEPGREGAHRRVSREADGKVKLTVALDGARAQRRPRNKRWTSAGGGGGSRFAWAERERARELGRGRKWKRGGGRAGREVQKGRGGSVVAGERADVGVTPQCHLGLFSVLTQEPSFHVSQIEHKHQINVRIKDPLSLYLKNHV
jgi:hypothetical protein